MINWLRFITLSIASIIIVRLAQLQIIQGGSFIQRSSQNRFRIENIPAKRGTIYDRNGRIIAITEKGIRKYPMGANYSHIIGYLSSADEQDLEYFGVEIGQQVGKMGIEKEENQILTGTDGGVVEETSATGIRLREYSQKTAIDGRSIQLTIDSDLQNKARQLLADSGYKGVIIVGNLQGDLLAIVSYPDFDPNIFSNQNREEITAILKDYGKPLFNRAIGGVYPPASTFKLVTAIAGLESRIITKDTLIEDTGVLNVGDFSYSNWFYTGYGGTDGQVNITKALQRSNDIYFYKIGELTGINNIAIWARKMGLGSKTGLPLEGEAEGLVPDQAWKKSTIGEDWYLGDTYITSIGQGNLLVTPLQIESMTNSIANGGKRCPTDVIAATVTKPLIQGQIIRQSERKRCFDLGISSSTLDLIKQGMKLACESGGTGWPLYNFKIQNSKIKNDDINYLQVASTSADLHHIPVACKTGTAEIGGFDQHGKLNEKTHAWFTAFAPVVKPEVIVTVLLEEAGQGSDKAGPLAREMLRTYFEGVK